MYTYTYDHLDYLCKKYTLKKNDKNIVEMKFPYDGFYYKAIDGSGTTVRNRKRLEMEWVLLNEAQILHFYSHFNKFFELFGLNTKPISFGGFYNDYLLMMEYTFTFYIDGSETELQITVEPGYPLYTPQDVKLYKNYHQLESNAKNAWHSS